MSIKGRILATNILRRSQNCDNPNANANANANVVCVVDCFATILTLVQNFLATIRPLIEILHLLFAFLLVAVNKLNFYISLANHFKHIDR